ncbi:hypothetical protein EMCRGX_G001763 [Ephydatia muelleri]
MSDQEEINRQLREASKVGNIEVVVELLQRGDTISTPCHGTISTPCHGTISTPCHGTISIPCHGTIPSHVMVLSPSHVMVLSPSHVMVLSPPHVMVLSPSHVMVLSPPHVIVLSPSHVMVLSPSHVMVLSPPHVMVLSPPHVMVLSPSHVMVLSPSHVIVLSPSHVMVLSPSHVMVLSPPHVMVLSPPHVMMSHVMVLSPSHVMVLSPSHVMVLSPSHDMVLAPSHVMVLSPSHVMDRWSSLMWACVFGNAEVVKILVSAGAHVNDQSKYGTSSLMWACCNGNAEVVRILVSAGAHINHQNKDGTSSLMEACRYHHAEVVQILVSAGAHVNDQDKDGTSSLMEACRYHHAEVVQILVSAGAHVNDQDKRGTSSLMEACKYHHAEVVKILVSAGAHVNDQRKVSSTSPMTLGDLYPDVRLYSEVETIIMTGGRDGTSSLKLACEKGHAEVVKILVSAGAHVNDQDKDGTSSLKLACEKGHAEVVKILVSAGAHVNDQRKDGTSSLNLACKNGNADVVKILVSAGAHVNHQDVIVVRLPIWSVLDRLMNKWMPSPDQLMSGLVGVRAALSIRRSCFQGVWLQPLLHVTQHFQSQWQSCRLVVNGPLEALETWMASLSIGFLEAGLLYTRERCRDWDQLEGVAETLVASGTSGLDGCGRWGQGSGLDNGGSCCKGSGCVSLTSGFKNSALIVIRVPGMAICASSSHDGKQFLPLYGMEWEALLWLPVTLEPSPIVVHVGPKSWGASGISEELKRVSCCPFWVQEHGDTIPRRKKAVPPPNVCCCLGIKAHMMVELSDCGGEIDQTAEEDSAGTTLAAACPWGGAGAVAQRLIGIDANLVNRRGLTPLKLARGYEVLTMLRKYTTSCEDFPVHTYGKVIMCGDSGAGKSTLTEAIIECSQSMSVEGGGDQAEREKIKEALWLLKMDMLNEPKVSRFWSMLMQE